MNTTELYVKSLKEGCNDGFHHFLWELSIKSSFSSSYNRAYLKVEWDFWDILFHLSNVKKNLGPKSYMRMGSYLLAYILDRPMSG